MASKTIVKMFMKRLYRFVLKRVIGPFLINNDIAIKDLDVKLRERTVELRNLQLDADVINSSLGLSELSVVSARVESVILSGKDGFAVKVAGIRVVVEPRGPHVIPPKPVEVVKPLENDDVDVPAPSESVADTSLSEGLSSVESWIERSMNMLKVEISDVLIEIRLPEHVSKAFPYSLLIHVEACESQTNFDAAYRQTELFGVNIALKNANDSTDTRIIYVEPSSALDNKVCLIRAALDETFKERGYEISLFELTVTINPGTLAALIGFYARFSQVNAAGWDSRSGSPGVRIRNEGKASTVLSTNGSDDDGGEEFFDAQSSMVQSGLIKSFHDASPEQDAIPLPPPPRLAPTVFHVEINRVSLVAEFGTNSSIVFAGRGIVLNNSNASINKLSCDVQTSSGCDLSFDFETPDHANSVVYNMTEQKINVASSVTVTTSNKFSTLLDLSKSYGTSLGNDMKSDEFLSKGSYSTSNPSRIVLESVPELKIKIRGNDDAIVLRLESVSFDPSSGFASRSGDLGVVPLTNGTNTRGELFMLLQKSVLVTLVDNDGIDLRQSSAESESAWYKAKTDGDEEEPELAEAVQSFETSCMQIAGGIIDISIGSMQTPEDLDPEVYQRFMAVVNTMGASEPSAVLAEMRPPGLPFIRASCPFGRISIAGVNTLPATVVEFRDLSSLSYNSDSVVRIQHLSVCERMLETNLVVPIIFSSPFASDSISSALAMVERRSDSDLRVRVVLANHTYRFEAMSEGLRAISTLLTPDGRGAPVDVGFRTDVQITLQNLVVDVFPAQSPFLERPNVTQGRLMATLGKLSIASCETLSTVKRFDVDLEDAELYLANRSGRDQDEHIYSFNRGSGLVIQEYAELNGFVRIGEINRGSFFIRVEGIDWDAIEIEAAVPKCRMVTCADSLECLVDLVSHVSDEFTKIASGAPSSPRGSLKGSPQSPILILARSTSAIPAIDLMQLPPSAATLPDSELPASALRERMASAPDSSLNAKQLRARYTKEPYLLPHVIDDYYSLGSLPADSIKAKEKIVVEDGTATLIGRGRTSSFDLLADFDIVSMSPTPPPVAAPMKAIGARASVTFERPASSQREQPYSSVPAKKPPHVASSEKRKKTFMDDNDDEGSDADDEMMMRSVMFTAPEHDSQGSAQVTADSETASQAIQLIELAEIATKAKHGSVEAQQLQESIMGLVETTGEAGNDSNVMAESEANLYKTALLASSVAFERDGGGNLWYPGRMLVQQEISDEEEEQEQEEDGTAKYYDEGGGANVQVRAHHFPIPVQPKPGSFLPPQPALAARIEAGGDIKDVVVRGKLRVILRNCGFSWGLFGGSDFPSESLALFEPIYGLPHVATSQAKPQSNAKKTVVIVENHFQAGQPLFESSAVTEATMHRRASVSRRDVDRVVEIVANGVSLLLDSFGDGAMSLSLAIHDLDLLDQVRASPVKKLFQHWDNERLHPRYTAEDMVRFTLDISAKNTYQIHLASLPVRLIINQDTLELLNSFGSPKDPKTKEPVKPPVIEFADFRAVKMKIDYYPKRVDISRIKAGRYSELVHLFSYQGMEVALKRAQLRSVKGLDALGAALAEYWAQDVLNKQIHQLLAGLSPTIKNVATDMADIVLLPVDLFRGKASAASVGTKAQKFAKTIVVEGCGVGKRVASAAVNIMDDRRTRRLPRDMQDGVNIAAQALASRAKQVHHTIIAVPLTVWQREGVSGALKSVIRAIPVAVIQPVLGLGEAIEALSSGVQFQMDPEELKEEARRWKNSAM